LYIIDCSIGRTNFEEKQVLWSYHTTPHSTTQEAPFTMVYGTDAMLPVEINTPTWRRDNFSKEGTQCFPISLTFYFTGLRSYHTLPKI
jgi:hypothetical protein